MIKHKRKESKKVIRARLKKTFGTIEKREQKKERKSPIRVFLPRLIQIRQLAELTGLPAAKIISTLLENGVTVNLNESIDFETAAIILSDLGFEAEPLTPAVIKKEILETEKKKLKPRTPVVTVVGHVDHGKTTLLDALRETNVAEKESGGITQQISAYQIKFHNHLLTFLDTPGHQAFTLMRAHGISITDIAILVVAADDGVMPQTKEAISHIKAADIPVVIAINKIDKPEAEAEKVKRQLADEGLLVEDWGGNVPAVEISAKQKINLDKLLELICLVAEVSEIKADPSLPPAGVVIEAHLEKGIGPVAILLIHEGTLHLGDCLLIKDSFARVRLLQNYKLEKIKSAGPGTPVRISGLKKIVQFGDIFEFCPNEEEGKKLILSRQAIWQPSRGTTKTLKKGDFLKVIIKAETSGALAALAAALSEMVEDDIRVKIISQAIGQITESDVKMALATEAMILGFRVPVNREVEKLAQTREIKISRFEVIYELLDYVKEVLASRKIPQQEEVLFGKIKILKIFYQKGTLITCGGEIIEGKLLKNNYLRAEKDPGVKSKITSIEVNRAALNEAASPTQCGLKLEGDLKFSVGDTLVCTGR